MVDTKTVDVYMHASRETVYEQGRELGLAGQALEYFAYTGYEEKITYAVNMETGESTPVALNDRELKAKGTT